MPSFGELLAAEIGKARAARGWTQRDVIERAFPDQSDVRQFGRYERAEIANPHPRTYGPICGALGISQERIFEIARISDNRSFLDFSYLEDMDKISPKALSDKVRNNINAENSACNLHHFIILNCSETAKYELEKLMSDICLPLVSLDYCYRYYHYAFRHKLRFDLHMSGIKYLRQMLDHENFDISDKAAFSIGEIFLYNPHQEIREIAKAIITQNDGYTDRIRGFMDYTKRRVGIDHQFR